MMICGYFGKGEGVKGCECECGCEWGLTTLSLITRYSSLITDYALRITIYGTKVKDGSKKT